MPRKSLNPKERKSYKGREIPVFCQNVARKREEENITQAELAAMIGTTVPRISELESGRLPRDEKRIIALAKALHVDINWLFGFTPEQENAQERPE